MFYIFHHTWRICRPIATWPLRMTTKNSAHIRNDRLWHLMMFFRLSNRSWHCKDQPSLYDQNVGNFAVRVTPKFNCAYLCKRHQRINMLMQTKYNCDHYCPVIAEAD
jgi:hypothetical protein